MADRREKAGAEAEVEQQRRGVPELLQRRRYASATRSSWVSTRVAVGGSANIGRARSSFETTRLGGPPWSKTSARSMWRICAMIGAAATIMAGDIADHDGDAAVRQEYGIAQSPPGRGSSEAGS
ncbi:hypothetical protein [Streptomyces griseofuscus]|uniref:hypothetical protein n=1 Tax=Streptomyces griseofuscus TaxID=146922 RepID=UPI000F64D144|nr:hypothetical protein [Streptomyces griseofuscus]